MTSRTPADRTAAALTATLISPNEIDSNMEPANVVDGLFAIARAVHHLADAVTGESAKADKRSEIMTNAIRSISHGGMSGPTSLEMLSMAINGEGAPGRNPGLGRHPRRSRRDRRSGHDRNGSKRRHR